MAKLMRWLTVPAVALAGFFGVLQILPSPDSPQALEEAETGVLSIVRVPYERRMVQAGPHRLHTLVIGDGSKPPLVMVHGHGGGLGVFAQNFDALSEAYTIYAVDLLGWGRSDRPRFTGSTAEEAQAWWVDSLEAWRAEVGLEQFTLLGHSMGGFVAASYALAHPEQVSHLILVDSGGLTRPVHPYNGIYFNLPPQRLVRVAGPLGPALVRWGRKEELSRGPYNDYSITDYYYQISAAPASGEVAFRKLLGVREWAIPLLEPLAGLAMPVTLIWGEGDTLILPQTARRAHELVPTSELVIIPGAGHSPHQETPHLFNLAVLDSQFRETESGN